MDQIKTGRFLQQLRKEKGLTQEQFAERFGVARRTVSRWETGSNMPDISLLPEIAEFYEISIPELIDGERKSEHMNEETKAVAEKMSDYAGTEKAAILKNIRNQSLIGVGALGILIVLELTGASAYGAFFDRLHLYMETLVYVTVILTALHATGLLYKLNRKDRKLRQSIPLLILFAAAVGLGLALVVQLLLRVAG